MGGEGEAYSDGASVSWEPELKHTHLRALLCWEPTGGLHPILTTPWDVTLTTSPTSLYRGHGGSER